LFANLTVVCPSNGCLPIKRLFANLTVVCPSNGCLAALKLLASWKVSIEAKTEIDREERELIMTLSQAYLEWEEKTQQQSLQQGLQQGLAQGQRIVVENLLKLRFGELDEQLAGIIPNLLDLPAEEYTRLLLQSSREELLARFVNPSA
jgi:hypothetical protein